MGKVMTQLAISVALLSLAALRLIFPKLATDSVAVGFLFAAVATWLLPPLLVMLPFRITTTKFKAANVEVELQAKTEGSPAPGPPAPEIAPADAMPPSQPATDDARSVAVRNLAEEFQTILVAWRTSGANSDVLVDVVLRMSAIASELSPAEIAPLLNAVTSGARLIGYVRLQQLPDDIFYTELISALESEDCVFCQWWCIQALRSLKESTPTGFVRDNGRLKRQLKKIPRRSDRYAELRSVVGQIEDKTTTDSLGERTTRNRRSVMHECSPA